MVFRIFIFLLFLLQSSLIDTHTIINFPAYIFRIIYPATLSHLKGISCYYKGIPYDLTEGWCLIKENHEIITVSLVIAEEIEWRSEGNNIRYLSRKHNAPCLWYDLTISLKQDGSYSWIIEPRSLDKVPLRLSENTIFLQLHPDLVEGVYNSLEDIEHPQGSKNGTRFLPILKLKKNINQELFEKKSLCPIMASVDLKTIHRKPREIIRSENPLMVSMITV